MDYSFAGFPLHVLLVHADLVLTPLVCLALIVVSAWPAARRVLWIPVLVAAAVLLPLGLVTIEAGSGSRRACRRRRSSRRTRRRARARAVVLAILVVAVLVSAWAVIELVARRAPGRTVRRSRRPRHPDRGRRRAHARRVAVAAGTTWTIVQIGESGSRAVWEGSFSDEPLER